jgi:mandelate racemase
MGLAELTIRQVRARPVTVPMRRPVRTALGTIPAAPLVLIDVLTEEGITGRAYLFAYTPLAQAPLARLLEDLSRELAGQPVVPFSRLRQLDRRFRLLGWQGLVGMTVSGLDMAFWDILARAADVPLVRLLGGEPPPLPAYDSYGMIEPRVDARDLEASLAAGFRAIKIKLGEGSLARDVAMLEGVRAIIGPEPLLMADYNQSLTPAEATRRIARLEPFNLAWIEEPVPAEDLEGHARVRAASPVPIQTGENWWFPRDMKKAITAGACDLAMPDVMKIGGVSGWLQAAAQGEATSIPISSHLFIEASAHLLAITPTAHYLEHLDVASGILAEPLQVVEGRLEAKGPGLGMDWDEKAVARLTV